MHFFHQAFVKNPDLAGDVNTAKRYDAACAAALAGCGQGQDAASLGDTERDHLRRLALDWLKADLQGWQLRLQKDPSKAGRIVERTLRHWLQDPDFNGVRGAEALSKLPEDERQSWQQLWTDVADTLAKSQGKANPNTKPDTK